MPVVLADVLDNIDSLVREVEMPPDPFERSVLVDHALVLAVDLLAMVQRLRAERAPYVTTYTVEERLAHRRPGATLEPPKDRPTPQPDPEPDPQPEPQPTPPTEGE